MQTKIKQLKTFFDQLFNSESIPENSYIEINDGESEMVLSANQEGGCCKTATKKRKTSHQEIGKARFLL